MPAPPEQIGLFEEANAATAGAPPQKRKRKRKPGARRPGPKPHADRKGFVQHGRRPAHHRRHPVHVTMRRVRLAPSFRKQAVYAVVLAEIAASKHRGVHVVEYSIQHDHLHLMVEGNDRDHLSKQMCRLFSRIAMAVNRLVRRSGPLFRDRHHRRALETPTEVRNALVYILFNVRKHARAEAGDAARSFLDGCSSAPWFRAWAPEARPPPDVLAQTRAYSREDITSRPRTWLAAVGWQNGGRRGPLRFDEQPRTAF